MSTDDAMSTQNDPQDAGKQKRSTVAVNAALIQSMRESNATRFTDMDVRFDSLQKALDTIISRTPMPASQHPQAGPSLQVTPPTTGDSTQPGGPGTSSIGNTDAQGVQTPAGMDHVHLRSHRFHPYGRPATHVGTTPAASAATSAPGQTGAGGSLQTSFQPLAGRTMFPATGADLYSEVDKDIDEKVRAIFESTAHNLSIKGKKICYPHNYVLRGEKKERVALGALTIAEHCWAILRVIEDANLPQEDKPFLVAHLDEVLEDARDYPWENVRRWSEEIFSLVGQKRIPGGWSNESKIQLLRISYSHKLSPHTAQGASSQVAAGSGKASSGGARGVTSSREQLKGGPPCKDYNVGQCNQQNGHILDGVKRIHICQYCIQEFSSVHTHAEKDCEIKKRQGSTRGRRPFRE